MKEKAIWKKGRGKLGLLQPLLGNWQTEADSPMGKVKCTRSFEMILGGKYVELNAQWVFGNKNYDERALFGTDGEKLCFWSFTSDGKRSEGVLAEAPDIDPEAICFEAMMPAGLARMVYWPAADGGFYWAVESRNKKGWNRFTEHHYRHI